MKKILFLLVSVLILAGCNRPLSKTFVPPTPDINSIVKTAVSQAMAAQPTQGPQLAQNAPPLLTPVVEASDKQVAAEAVNVTTSNGWEINELDLKDDLIVAAWLPKVDKPSPELWSTFPNVANPKVPDFQVANGVEYGQDDSPFCEYKQTCDWVVPAWHYRLISGDYKFTSPEFSYSCQNIEGQPRKGCLIVLFNVMNESFTWRNQSVDNGFTVMGRYWNGDALEWAVWGLTSHASANMLNLATMRDPTTGNVLNAGGNSANAGANCGVQPDACGTVDVMVVVHAGDRILATMHTTVSR